MGYAARALEDAEGDGNFSKTAGTWQILTRGGTLLIQKSLTNLSGSVTKT
jgi:hypothetical protein